MIHNNPKSIKAPIFRRKINQLNRTHLADLYRIQAKKKKVVTFAENSERERDYTGGFEGPRGYEEV